MDFLNTIKVPMTLWKLQYFFTKLYQYHTTFFSVVPARFFCGINAPLNVDLRLKILDLRLKYLCEYDAQQLLYGWITGL